MITRGDARALPLADGAADLILTSPPHLNAIDYCARTGSLWCGSATRSMSCATHVVGP